MLNDITVSIQAMGEAEVAILLLVVVVLTGGGFFIWKKFFQHARVMEDMPTSKVRSAAQGFVELAGMQHALEDKPLLAPLTQNSCTWWSYVIEKKKRSRSSKGQSRTTLGHGREGHQRRLLQSSGRYRADSREP